MFVVSRCWWYMCCRWLFRQCHPRSSLVYTSKPVFLNNGSHFNLLPALFLSYTVLPIWWYSRFQSTFFHSLFILGNIFFFSISAILCYVSSTLQRMQILRLLHGHLHCTERLPIDQSSGDFHILGKHFHKAPIESLNRPLCLMFPWTTSTPKASIMPFTKQFNNSPTLSVCDLVGIPIIQLTRIKCNESTFLVRMLHYCQPSHINHTPSGYWN